LDWVRRIRQEGLNAVRRLLNGRTINRGWRGRLDSGENSVVLRYGVEGK
jgi:hypothetical protein